jgi:uncharacterized protein YkwD
MVPQSPAPRSRRPAGLALAGLLAAALIVPASVAAAPAAPSIAAVSSAEASMLAALNRDRTARGLVPVRTDPRLMAIARARSVDMATRHYFSHGQPDGRNVFDILSAQRVSWYSAGEIIAWNTNAISTTTSTANSQWMHSPGHKAIVVSTTMNYVGVGLAWDSSQNHMVWTAVFMKGPDRTGPQVTFASPKVSAGTTSANRRVTLSWNGADVRLQVLTAGFRAFTLQSRIDDGAWRTVWSSTTRKSADFILALGHRYEFKVSAFDRRSNRGAALTRAVDLR